MRRSSSRAPDEDNVANSEEEGAVNHDGGEELTDAEKKLAQAAGCILTAPGRSSAGLKYGGERGGVCGECRECNGCT